MTSFAGYAAEHGIKLLAWEDDELALGAVANFCARYSHILESARRHGEPMLLDFHIIDSPGFNALAASFDDADVIVIYRDVLSTLLATCRALVSHGLLFPEHKLPEIEVVGICAGARMRDVALGTAKLDSVPLADPVREVLAQSMYQLASQFVLGHEFAHICNGHIDWLNQQTGLPLLAEMAAPDLPSFSGWERETLEWDADCTGMHDVIQLALSPEITVVGGRGVWTLPFSSGDPRTILQVQLTLVALMVVFLCISSLSDQDYDTPEPGTHPHPVLRLCSAQSMLFQSLDYRTGNSHEEFVEAYSDFLEPFFESWAKVFLPREPKPKDIDDDTLAQVLKDRAEKYIACWAELHDDLTALKRTQGALAPKVQTPHPAFPDAVAIG